MTPVPSRLWGSVRMWNDPIHRRTPPRHDLGRRAPRIASPPHAFSLIELLVAIGLIAVLTGLLLASLAGSRSAALQVTCAANLKNLGIATHAYARDFDLRIPYGPRARPTSVADFYVVDGMVTSQVSIRSGGAPVGAGLLIDDYLGHTPQVLFCPDNDQQQDASAELDRVGRTQAVSGYIYRHGSNTLEPGGDHASPLDRHTRLDDLGLNRRGRPITSLFIDQQFVVDPPAPLFNVVVRTNHQRRIANVLYHDGRAVTHDNRDQRFTVNLGNALYLAPSRMLEVLEEADGP